MHFLHCVSLHSRSALLFIFFGSLQTAAADHSITTITAAKTPAEPQRTLTIATGEYPPWTGAELPQQGLANQIVTEAFASQNIAVKFVYLPWKRAFEETRQGRFDASSYWYDSSARRAYMLFSEPLLLNRTVFFQRSDAPPIQWQTFTDLGSYRLSATVGFTYTSEFYQAIDDKIIDPLMVPSDTQNIKLLMAKRTDLFATEEMSGFYMAAQLRIDPRKLRVIEPALSSPYGYLLISKTHPDGEQLIAQFNRGLKAIKANGQYQKILTRIDDTSFYDPANSTPSPR